MTRKYNLINNIGGWLVFVIALVTYWCTLEPTASYWDCGEFIIQADKLEVGHPPGNPIFMLTARFFANFASSPETISLMVNAMSGLLSALTILLLFWSVTHLTRRIVIKDGQAGEPSLQQYIAVMGAGLAASLAYAWSDTFWFSAVEGEVYAFSSFCTALVFWLILKWEDCADEPHSDRYLILIAYIIGVSVAVHLLNLLCIPAIVLVFAYRKFKDMNIGRSLLALLVSFVIIFLVLYGLVPGLIKMAGVFELFFVNTLHFGFNSGAVVYALLTAAVLIWSLYTLNRGRSLLWMRISVVAGVGITGILTFGNSTWLWLLILAAFAVGVFLLKRFPKRVMSVIMWSISMIFVGYSSYALILIRSTADTPMNQNSPDNVFDLASYLNREQYGENPILYGQTFNAGMMKSLRGYTQEGIPVYDAVINKGKPLYVKGVDGAVTRSENGFLTVQDSLSNDALARRGGDYYVKKDYKPEPKMNPELNMLFPRLYSRLHKDAYAEWVPSLNDASVQAENMVPISAVDAETGEKVDEYDTQGEPTLSPMGTYIFPVKTLYKPTLRQNLEYFTNYQLNHMYTRYFMWNFAGRQNDLLNQHGELDAGNWISGIPFIDNARLGDQSQLPYELGDGNRGHNVYYMLPLILGLVGLIWQAFAGKRGIEQFWVVFFLFFMTGIAIVLYLNQTPGQPRERDYSFAGSFYAFAIWIGMGVPALWRILLYFIKRKGKSGEKSSDEEEQPSSVVNESPSLGKVSAICAGVAAFVGLVVPLQMLSQNWDDHDRSGRYAARDYAINYLESLEPNAIVFCNGDNDTFPLWYAQEVEGVRPDVRIVNLSYLSSDWYANQLQLQAYDSAPVNTLAASKDYAYGKRDAVLVNPRETKPVPLTDALKRVYADYGLDTYGYPTMPSSVVYIPVNKEQVVARGLVAPEDAGKIVDRIEVDLSNTRAYKSKGYLSLGDILMLDIVATNAANGWPRPIYWACTIGDEYHVGLTPYMRTVGMTHQIVPTIQPSKNARTDKGYDVITRKYLYGIRTTEPDKMPYYDETASRMLASVRGTMLITAEELMSEGNILAKAGKTAEARDKYRKCLDIVNLLEKNQPESLRPYELQTGPAIARLLCQLSYANRLADRNLQKRGLMLLRKLIIRYAQYVRYEQTMALTFGQTSLTYESFAIPYRFYEFVDMYRRYGGNVDKLLSTESLRGLNMKDLQEKYNEYTRQMDAADAAEATEAEQLDMVASIVNTLAAMSPQEYAAQDMESRLYDSLYWHLYEEMLASGYKPEELDAYPNIRKIDKERAKRLGNEFRGKHPEYFN